MTMTGWLSTGWRWVVRKVSNAAGAHTVAWPQGAELLEASYEREAEDPDLPAIKARLMALEQFARLHTMAKLEFERNVHIWRIRR